MENFGKIGKNLDILKKNLEFCKKISENIGEKM